MRGKGLLLDEFRFRNGITPAYAGKRQNANATNLCKGDHPRLCGEKEKTEPALKNSKGSPPPMRGKVFTDSCGGRVARITPAYAGKSHGERTLQNSRQDHPRLCGEKSAKSWSMVCEIGSPPPMRGKADSEKSFPVFHRITPAYAGKSSGLDVDKLGD